MSGFCKWIDNKPFWFVCSLALFQFVATVVPVMMSLCFIPSPIGGLLGTGLCIAGAFPLAFIIVGKH
jgi:hypothetical protein